jgi:hypothetical protein
MQGWIASKFQFSLGSFGDEYSAPSLCTQNTSEDNKKHILRIFQKATTVCHKSFWSHYGPGVDSASDRNEYQEYFLGVNAAGA